MKDRLKSALKQSTADYLEIRYELSDSASYAYHGQELENVAAGNHAGGIVRACTKGGWGLSVFNSPDKLDECVREACASAAYIGREKTHLAPTPPFEREITSELKCDFRGVGVADKLEVLNDYNNIILKHHKSISSSNVSYSERFRTVYFASSRGIYYSENRPLIRLHFSATAKDGSLVQSAYDGVSSNTDFAVILDLEDRVDAIAQLAVALLKAPSCPGGKHTVLLNPRLGGVFIHEAFGHLSEADHLYENPQMLAIMRTGNVMGNPDLNVIDDSSYGNTIATHPYDDEGTATGKAFLIKNGILHSHLHSLETAAKMGEKPTGNARAISYAFPPIVRMTNTYIDKGADTYAGLVSGIDKGIYACDMAGGMTNMEMFTFSAGYGYRIENGKLGELLRDVVLTGNVFHTLKAINGIADDFQLFELPGGCGKNGQSPLPVTFGSPHLRIADVVIGGREGSAPS